MRAVRTEHDGAGFVADPLGLDIAGAEAETLLFIVADEGLTARIDHDHATGLREDLAASLIALLPLGAEILKRRGPGAAAPGAMGVSACVARGTTGIGAATAGGERRAMGAAFGGSAVWPPPGAGAALGATGAARGATGAAAGGAGGVVGGWPVRAGGGAIFPRSNSLSLPRSWGAAAGGGDGGTGGVAECGGGGAAGCGGGGGGGAVGCCGGGGAAGCGGGGAAGCGGGEGGGAAGCGGGGGACRGGGAGGAGCAAGGAAFGGCLGFPSGPSSSLCATTIGDDCACDGVVITSCMAVNAVVASNAILEVCHVLWVLRGSLKVVKGCKNLSEVITYAIDQRTSVRPDCGGFQTGTRIYFSRDTMRVADRS